MGGEPPVPKYGAASKCRNGGGQVPSRSREAQGSSKIYARAIPGLSANHRAIYKEHYDSAIEAHGEREVENFDPTAHYTPKKHENTLLKLKGKTMSVLKVNSRKKLIFLINENQELLEEQFNGVNPRRK